VLNSWIGQYVCSETVAFSLRHIPLVTSFLSGIYNMEFAMKFYEKVNGN